MRSVKFLVAAGAVTLMSSAAFAADMPIAPPPMSYAPPPVEDFGGWYLRGDIGFSNQRVNRLNNALDSTLTSSVQTNNFNSAGIFGLGVGYKVNNWFRADVTGEYRGNSQFFGTDRNTFVGGVGTDTYHGVLVDERSGSLNPAKYVHGLAAAATRSGARVVAGVAVTGAQRTSGRWLVATIQRWRKARSLPSHRPHRRGR